MGAIVGVIVDMGSTIVFSIAMFFVLGMAVALSGRADVSEQMLVAMSQSSPWREIGLMVGGLGSLIGGYVCLRLAGRSLAGAAWRMVLVTLMTAVPMYFISTAQIDWQQRLLNWGISFGAMALGWVLGHWRNRQLYHYD
ncbi:hypothetical protein A11A3_06450 [Alcanivorax hongdengensis A-11-3]|uniref:Uncharacterized protein n=2 Tax=Alcanivorax hongdengensis TaxID=519051 RepID=L0WD21_9GAMM|nr:hypothetical protein A11A3_06450 [Alcanivorax hongdengensis A-11-3]